MNTTLLYELRVLSGEQRGATSAVRLGDTLRIGREWSNDVVLQDAGDSCASLLMRDDGSLALGADGGDCSVDGALLAEGEPAAVDLYTPFTVGGTRMAVGRLGASQWATLFDDAPATEAPAAQAHADTAALAAHKASISTPVCPTQLAVVNTRIPTQSCTSGSSTSLNATSTAVSARG